MTFVNDFIFYKITSGVSIDSSYCLSMQDNEYLYLTFGLNANDCLFDISQCNYLINIRFTKTYFEKYNEPFDLNIERQSICCNTQSKLMDLINCKLTGIHKKIFFESTLLFLLFQSQKNSLISQLGCDTCSVLSKPTETEKMHLAKNYIIENLDKNLTISIIAGVVGTNQCYLKKGFKEVYNQTIFEFIQENRMIKAKYMINNSELSISEIAFAVGYASLSSFSQAFKNYYGVSPLEHAKANFPII